MIRVTLFSISFLLLSGSSALACKEINGIPDFNCDGKVQIAFMGDSFVYGVGDTKNKGKGGYVLRAKRSFPRVTMLNFGKAGLNTSGLHSQLEQAFDDNVRKDIRNGLAAADVIILDVGRNDRWFFGEPVTTFKSLVQAGNDIRAEVKKLTGLEPLVVTAVLMLPNRGSQGPWVKDLNTIIAKSSKTSRPADLRFDTVSKRLLNEDQIHPTSKGYDELAKVFVKYVKTSLIKKMKALRPDTDKDGIPDAIERVKTLTDPFVADSDGDGVSDGDEYLVYGTDPLSAPVVP